jgi:hypothetical protein
MKRYAIIALCCLLTVGVAATASAVDSTSASTLNLCAVGSSIQQAVVARTNVFPSNRLSFTFPAHVSITSKLRARTIASAICELPRFPDRPRCPNDLGVTYLVRFLGPNLRVSIDPYGCQTISGAGPRRWAALSPSFWHTLGRQMGIPDATLKTFQGHKS